MKEYGVVVKLLVKAVILFPAKSVIEFAGKLIK